jgi:hypothetical protein
MINCESIHEDRLMREWRYISRYSYPRHYLYIDGSTALGELGGFFQFFNLYTDGRTPCTGDQPVAKPLPTHKTAQTQNNRTNTFIPRVEFKPTIPVFEPAKTVHVLDQAATVIGTSTLNGEKWLTSRSGRFIQK